MIINTAVVRRTYRGRTESREERVYSGKNHGQDRYLAGAHERMTSGGVQLFEERTARKPPRHRGLPNTYYLHGQCYYHNMAPFVQVVFRRRI